MSAAQQDSAFQCLLLAAMLHHLEFDEARLWHEHNDNGAMHWVQLARAAKDIGFWGWVASDGRRRQCGGIAAPGAGFRRGFYGGGACGA